MKGQGFLPRLGSPDLTVRDGAIAFCLAVATFIYVAAGGGPYERDWRERTFYQRYYGTAVMSVCGHGWYSTPTRSSPELHRFLELQVDSFECRDLPDQPEKVEPNYQAISHQYLFRAVALTWKLRREISWQGLWPLFACLAALVSGLAYSIGRLGSGPLLSTVMTLAFLPFHLKWLPYLRDYAKAPFILANVFLLGYLIRKTPSQRRLLAVSALMGLNTGIGLGFRPDVMITVPAIVLGLLCFLPMERRYRGARWLAPALFLATAGLAHAPVLQYEKPTHATSHVALLGFSDKFTRALALESPVYEWGRGYSDPLVDFQVKSRAYFELGIEDEIPVYSEAYGEISRQEFLGRVLGFPADTVVRSYAAVLNLVKLPLLVASTLLIAWTVSGRLALFLLLTTLYFTGYTSAQFHPRHFFLWEFIPFWYLAFAGHGLAKLLPAMAPRPGRIDSIRRELRARWCTWRRRLLVGVVAAILSLWLPLVFLRSVQSEQLYELLADLETAPLQHLGLREDSSPSGRLLLQPVGLLQPLPTSPPQRLEVGTLVILVDAAGCTADPIDFSVRFEPARYDYSRQFRIEPTSEAPARIFVPIYSRVQSHFGNSRFLGVEVDAETRGCLGLKALQPLDEHPPILSVRLHRDWRRLPRYMVFSSGEPRPHPIAAINRAVVRWRHMLNSWRSRQPSHPSPEAELILKEDFESGNVDRSGFDVTSPTPNPSDHD